MMTLDSEVRPDGIAVLHPRGRLTIIGAGDLKALIDAVVAEGHHVVVVDLDETVSIDSSGLGALVGGLRTARAAGGDLRIANPTSQVRMVLDLTTMDRVFRPHASVEDAVGAS